MHKKVFTLAPASLLLVVALGLAGCSKKPPQEEPVRAVKLLTVGADSFTAVQEFAGEVRARVESRLGFRVGGKIIRRPAELGQRVSAGQLLAQLDPQDYKLAVQASQAQLSAARTNRDLAAADFKRYKELKEQNFISGAELERREATLKAAQAQFEQAQSQLAVQGNQASYSALVADVSGVVTGIDAEMGQVVSAGTPVVRIAADGPRDVVFSVPEDKVAAVRTGLSVKLRAWSQAAELTGKVREVAASADPATRTYSVKVALDAGQPAPPLGATVTVLMKGLNATPGASAQVIKLPTTALRQEGKGTAVWVLDESTMTLRSQAVEVSTADGNEAVVTAGLAPGMKVVSAGVHVLSPGQKVTVYQPKKVGMSRESGSGPVDSTLSAAAGAPATPASK